MVTPVKDGDQVITLLDITQPRCALSYGEAPCEAVLGETGEHKCFNTRASCQDPDNYAPKNGSSYTSNGTNNTLVLERDEGTQSNVWSAEILFRFNNFTSVNIYNLLRVADNADDAKLVVRIYREEEDTRFLDINYFDTAGDAQSVTILKSELSDPVYAPVPYRFSLIQDNGKVDVFINGKDLSTGISDFDHTLVTDGVKLDIGANTVSAQPNIGEVSFYRRRITPRKDVVRIGIHRIPDNIDMLIPHTEELGEDDLLNNWIAQPNASFNLDTTVAVGEYPGHTTRYRKDESIPDIYGRCIPSLRSVSITPGQINIGAMDRNVSPFGRRNVADLTFEDHPSLDIEQDPYFEERISGAAQADGIGYNPEERGQYWAKWLARNPFYNGYEAVIYRGAVGQPVEEMQQFRYVIDQISGPDDNGGVSMTLKDLFSRVTERKAKLPKASRGELVNDLPDTETGSFEVSVSPITGSDLDAEYPASGEFRVAIGSEVIRVTRSGGTFTIVARADIGTQIDSHDADDTVQLVYAQEALRATQIVRNMLVEGTTVTDDQIPLTDWNAEADDFFPNLYTGYIVKPTPVDQMIGELAEQAGFSIWPEIETGMIRVRALSAQSAASADLLESRDILDDGIDKKRRQDSRVSQVWVYFGLIDPTEDLDDNTNYRTRLIRGDLAAEDDAQYGTQAIREVYSRWIPQFGRGAAETVGDRILSLFRDPPLSASFNLSVTRALPFELAQRFNITLDREQDFTGLARQLAMVPIQIMRNEDRLMIASQELRFFTPPDQARNIFIDSDIPNETTPFFNLRETHDGLFGAPASGDEIVCFINAIAGSSDPETPSFTVGNWPEGVAITIVISSGSPRIAGPNGAGGQGGTADGNTLTAGEPGGTGGTAIFTRYPITIENNSIIQAGGGGAGGGGAAFGVGDPGNPQFSGTHSAGGGGGGAGAGRVATTVGPGGVASNSTNNSSGQDGQSGDLDSGGAGGAGGSSVGADGVGATGGDGGQAGAPAESGSAGTSGSGANSSTSGGAGGDPGIAVDGESFVTYTVVGAITGARVN